MVIMWSGMMMQELWGDESHILKFYSHSCPRLYELNTIAYWIIEKGALSERLKVHINKITQVAIDLSIKRGKTSPVSRHISRTITSCNVGKLIQLINQGFRQTLNIQFAVFIPVVNTGADTVMSGAISRHKRYFSKGLFRIGQRLSGQI